MRALIGSAESSYLIKSYRDPNKSCLLPDQEDVEGHHDDLEHGDRPEELSLAGLLVLHPDCQTFLPLLTLILLIPLNYSDVVIMALL